MKEMVQKHLEDVDLRVMRQPEMALQYAMSVGQFIRALKKDRTAWRRLLLEERKRRYCVLKAKRFRVSFAELSVELGYTNGETLRRWVRRYFKEER